MFNFNNNTSFYFIEGGMKDGHRKLFWKVKVISTSNNTYYSSTTFLS